MHGGYPSRRCCPPTQGSLVKKLFFLIYEWLLIPAVILLLPVISIFIPKVKDGLKLRKSDRLSEKTLKNCIWIHVSSGEWEYAKPLARALKEKGEKILVTHFSPSVRKSLENSKEVDVVFALPFDNSLFLKNFFKRFQPKLLMIARTDAWPVLLRETKKNKLPIFLFGATLSNDVLNSRSFFTNYISELKFSFVDKVFCVSEADRTALGRFLPESKVMALGDTRYDQVLYRLQNPKRLRNITDSRYRYFVAGSTWPTDERMLTPIIREVQQNSAVRFILVPHEPTSSHLEKIKSLLHANQLKAHFYSDTLSHQWCEDAASVLVVDEIGILAELYLKATYAFVGNSFERHAVHSVMEALAAGCLTFVGPFHKNNREAIEFSEKILESGLHPVEVIHASHDLKDKLLVAEATTGDSIKNEIREQISLKAGASHRVLNEIFPR